MCRQNQACYGMRADLFFHATSVPIVIRDGKIVIVKPGDDAKIYAWGGQPSAASREQVQGVAWAPAPHLAQGARPVGPGSRVVRRAMNETANHSTANRAAAAAGQHFGGGGGQAGAAQVAQAAIQPQGRGRGRG